MKNKKIYIDLGYNHSTKKFSYIYILPAISVCIDKQMDESFKKQDGTMFIGIKEYSIGISWLKFCFYITLEIKNK